MHLQTPKKEKRKLSCTTMQARDLTSERTKKLTDISTLINCFPDDIDNPSQCCSPHRNLHHSEDTLLLQSKYLQGVWIIFCYLSGVHTNHDRWDHALPLGDHANYGKSWCEAFFQKGTKLDKVAEKSPQQQLKVTRQLFQEGTNMWINKLEQEEV